MKVPKATGNYYLFPDKLTTPALVEFVEAKEIPSKDGKMQVPVMVVLGKVADFEGEMLISQWKCKFDKTVTETLGDDFDNWKTPKLKLSATQDNRFISVHLG